MATVWLALRADVRRRWRALVSLALLLGLAGGVVLIAAAGARRTDTAYPRLLSWANASEVEVTPGEPRSGVLRRASPAAAGRGGGDGESVHHRAAGTAAVPDTQLEALPARTGAYGATVDRVKILEGRMFSPGAADEAVIDPQLASMEHLRPGDTLHLLGIPRQHAGDGRTSRAPSRSTSG